MFKNYLKIAMRILIKHRGYSLINISGLAIGIACSILMYFFIKSELTYDQFHEDYSRIYRVGLGINFQGLEYWDTTPYPLADAMISEIPGVEAAARFTRLQAKQVIHGQEHLKARIHLVGPAFFDIFDFSTVAGSPSSILSDRHAVIISDRMRQKYFNGRDAVGEVLSIEIRDQQFEDFRIGAVAERVPENSSIKFDIIASELLFADIFGQRALTEWFPKTSTVTFFKANPQASIDEIELGLQPLSDKHNLTTMLRLDGIEKKFLVENLEKIHFGKSIPNRFLEPKGDSAYSLIMAGIAILVLLIACINFMNLSLGLSESRTGEVGVRKVCGARRSQLLRQFWVESIFMSFAALAFGLLLAELFLPTFNTLAGKQIELSTLQSPETVATLIAIGLFVGLVSGSYPALVLSGLLPAKIFRGALNLGGASIFSRIMIIFQFAVSILLVTGTLVMSYQLNYISNLNLGMDPQVVVYHNLSKRVSNDFVDRYRQQVSQFPGVMGVTAVRGSLTGDSPGSMWLVSYQGERMQLAAMKVDYDFLDVMGIELVAGRNLSRDFQSDLTGSILVNEKFVERFGLEDPVGKEAPLGGDGNPIIVGVVKDFRFQSARKFIEPMVLNLRPDSDNDQLLTKITSQHISATLEQMREAWAGLDPGMPFEYSFFDQVIQNQYQSEQNFKRIAAYSSYFAIAIACLGLFGLASLAIVRRSKEIGIRKVFGASIVRILSLFNKEFLLLVLIANIIAWPVAFIAMSTWLETFSYRIEMSWWMFLIAGILTLGLALITVSGRAVHAALAKPVDSLRHE